MTRYEEETYTAISRSLPKIANSLDDVVEQLKIANKLKALELKRAVDPSVKAPYEWIKEISEQLIHQLD